MSNIKAAFRIRVFLPPGWDEAPSDGMGRVYRPAGGGVLRLRVGPPLTPGRRPTEQQMLKFIDDFASPDDVERILQQLSSESSMGRVAIRFFIHKRYGAVFYGLTCGPAGMIFGTHESLNPARPVEEMLEAADILAHAELVPVQLD